MNTWLYECYSFFCNGIWMDDYLILVPVISIDLVYLNIDLDLNLDLEFDLEFDLELNQISLDLDLY